MTNVGAGSSRSTLQMLDMVKPAPTMLFSRFFRFFRYLNAKTLWKMAQSAGEARLTGLAAEMAYNAMLALFPAILAFLAAIGLFQPLQATIYKLASEVGKVAPDDVRSLVRGFIDELSTSHNLNLFSASFVGALWAFSGVINTAMAALDRIHNIPITLARPFWKAKLVSLSLSLAAIWLLINASFLVFISDLIVETVAKESGNLESGLLAIWRRVTWPAALGIVALAFGLVYRFGPSYRDQEMPIMPGAILAAIFWAILSSLFREYVLHFGNYNRTYGAVGAVIVLMFWLYLSSLVMLVGAQLNVTVGEAMRRRSR